jgi:hypothetical protein
MLEESPNTFDYLKCFIIYHRALLHAPREIELPDDARSKLRGAQPLDVTQLQR